MHNNYVYIKIPSLSNNESFARAAVAAFCSSLNPTIEEISDIKTAVSEAVTNAIIHGYENMVGDIVIQCRIKKSWSRDNCRRFRLWHCKCGQG
jgi:stage II sporulation protein AB (anti-sigma F factor)